MKKQSGFTIIEFCLVLVIIGIIVAIAIPALRRAKVAATLGTYYGMEVVPHTAEEKDAARPYMQKRLSEYQATIDAIIAEQTALTKAAAASTGPEVKERIAKIRDIMVRYNEAQDNLTVARYIYYNALAMEPDPTKK